MRSLYSILIILIATAIYYAKDHLQSYISLVTDNTALSPAAMPSATPFAGLPVIPASDPSLSATDPVPRQPALILEARSQAEGAGATVRRSIGTAHLRSLTPFLMLDHFSIAPGAGFPDHPHRGQETITYLLSGAVDHEDFAGHAGRIHAGDLQFMTAGRGIVHAEMPAPNIDGSANVGLQLWVDLPAALKGCEPRYRDLKADEIPVASDAKVTVKVISGRALGKDSLSELAYTPVWVLDFTVRPGGSVAQPLPRGWNAFAYMLNGTARFGAGEGAEDVGVYHNVVLGRDGDVVNISVDEQASQDARFVLVAGMPLEQEIVQYGPFVGTKREDIHKAIFDYQSFSNGFERAKGWESEIGKSMVH